MGWCCILHVAPRLCRRCNLDHSKFKVPSQLLVVGNEPKVSFVMCQTPLPVSSYSMSSWSNVCYLVDRNVEVKNLYVSKRMQMALHKIILSISDLKKMGAPLPSLHQIAAHVLTISDKISFHFIHMYALQASTRTSRIALPISRWSS
jgi:hypothetical protein